MARPARRLSGLDPEEIKAKVRMAGETMVGLAQKHDFSLFKTEQPKRRARHFRFVKGGSR
jgi:hypothetical protein